jgi:hypothetical protein
MVRLHTALCSLQAGDLSFEWSLIYSALLDLDPPPRSSSATAAVVQESGDEHLFAVCIYLIYLS